MVVIIPLVEDFFSIGDMKGKFVDVQKGDKKLIKAHQPGACEHGEDRINR